MKSQKLMVRSTALIEPPPHASTRLFVRFTSSQTLKTSFWSYVSDQVDIVVVLQLLHLNLGNRKTPPNRASL